MLLRALIVVGDVGLETAEEDRVWLEKELFVSLKSRGRVRAVS